MRSDLASGDPGYAENRKDVNEAAEKICKLIEEKMKPTAANSKL